ncbi:Homeobox domain [Geosmithia morbida]|uniref:Homeobox domain n=1 Tax=Geosmithia morbida TaxID=1094350 RepID=A0A9P5D8Q3_9HYPO|nr:Homeobox domain [Geosmithia morbida]KAF4127025.1 Homeobox domain [Geosmithia morbida]
MLQRQTGLTKTQILNWMANARRRGKMAERSRTDSPRTRSPSPSRPADIPPQRAGTPAPHMKPLDRWVDSPPENEPAAVAAIARAVQESSSSAGPSSRRSSGDGSSDRNYRPSPSSSVGGTSLSSGASGYSFDSRDSKGSVGAVPRRHHGLRSARRRRKPGDRGTHRDKNPGKSGTKTPLVAPINTFQCTFCTETFSSKHTWQRHEKSLHLPLERWVCAPKGPRALDVTGTKSTCAFCDLLDPGDEHISMHNYAVCHQRNLEERTFHRKDHLGQHLRLVHNLAPDVVGRRLAQWKMDTPTIRSVCGFCSTSLDSWEARADHLAEHFKMGNTMADWKGDWGFEPHILARLEDSLAPYMIAQERTAPFPFAASKTPVESPRSAYELIKLELLIFVDMYYDRTGRIPSSDELQFDACRVIFTAEVPSYSREQEEHPSWLRDLVFSSDSVVRKARLNPLRPAAESRLSFLGVIGKKGPFDSCPLEAQLVEFVEERRRQGADEITPHQLQAEACRLMHLADRLWPSAPADIPATWLMGLAKSCTGWLDLFRVRVGLIPPFERPERPTPCIMDTSALDSVLNNYNILDDKLIRRMEARSMDPTNSELRQQMLSCIMSEFDDETDAEWKRAAAANDAWLARFKRRHFAWSGMYTPPAYEQDASLHAAAAAAASSSSPSVLVAQGSSQYQPLASTAANMTACGNIERILKAPYFLNEPNFDRWVPRELARWVAATMSPNNPNQHVPTDEELQNQSRWIMYEE